jgi:hypothetical protein
MKVAMGDLSMSSDAAALKVGYIGQKWAIMPAGDVSCYPDVRRYFIEYLTLHDIKKDSISRPEISDGLKYAFEKVLKINAEADVLAAYGLTFDNYRDEGPKLGPDVFSRILYSLQEQDLGLKLLIAGYGEKGNGHIFTVEKRGLSQHFDAGAWAIGSGDIAAIGYLFSSQINIMKDADEVFYHVCCAKFAAETSPGVGEKTTIAVLKKDGSRKIFDDDDIRDIRREWNRTHKRKISESTLYAVKELLKQVKPAPQSDSQKSEDQQ